MSQQLKPLKGVRVLSLALNLPGPAALMRCKAMGATCVKVDPPAPRGAPPGAAGDPMATYNPAAYREMHEGIKIVSTDLKSEAGLAKLHSLLGKTDVLITSFRPSALRKLGLDWKALQKLHPRLSQVAIVGSPGEGAEEPGHDLTYLAANGLVSGLALPPTLYADMGGSLMAAEAVLKARLLAATSKSGRGVYLEVALSEAARYLGLPHHWGLTQENGPVGGAHAGYRVYECRNGRVAVAALEPHFAASLCAAAGYASAKPGAKGMMTREARDAIAEFFKGKTRAQLDKLATEKDIPLHTLP